MLALLPRDKHDIACVQRLAALDAQTILPFLDELLDWVSDGNWPIAVPMGRLLASQGNYIIEPLRRVLRGNDSMKKFWCLELAAKRLAPVQLALLGQDLRDITRNPSEDDIAEDVTGLAQELLATLAAQLEK